MHPSNIQLENVVKTKSFMIATKPNIFRSITRKNLLDENEQHKLIWLYQLYISCILMESIKLTEEHTRISKWKKKYKCLELERLKIKM